jgi:hypothetical protein
MRPSQLLTGRREEDAGDDLWSTLNRVQENLLRGGLSRRAASGRLTRTRHITSIREDVRINGRLWDLASEVLAARAPFLGPNRYPSGRTAEWAGWPGVVKGDF